MEKNKLMQEISAKDVDIPAFVRLVMDDEHARDSVIELMVTNPAIMVYYHCYEVVAKASQEKPELFYKYWSAIVPLLKHKNSYHRDIALTIIANLSRVDDEDKFSEIFLDYFNHINDEKYMTGRCCAQNGKKILRYKPELKNQIIALLLDIENRCTYPEKQKGLLKYDVLEILDEMYAEMEDTKKFDEFIQGSTASTSSKTRNKARELVRKFGL